VREAAARFRDGYEALSGADRVLLLGAGPVGIELAGEIAAVWPAKQVTIVDIVGDLLGGRFKPELRRELHRQLEQHEVKLVLGSPLRESPSTPPGILGTFTVSTEAGTEITADLWFRCYGVTPQSDYLAGDLATSRTQADSSRSPRRYSSQATPTCSHSATFRLSPRRWLAVQAAKLNSLRTTSTR
jgi:apoptosis-inducing factor 2